MEYPKNTLNELRYVHFENLFMDCVPLKVIHNRYYLHIMYIRNVVRTPQYIIRIKYLHRRLNLPCTRRMGIYNHVSITTQVIPPKPQSDGSKIRVETVNDILELVQWNNGTQKSKEWIFYSYYYHEIKYPITTPESLNDVYFRDCYQSQVISTRRR